MTTAGIDMGAKTVKVAILKDGQSCQKAYLYLAFSHDVSNFSNEPKRCPPCHEARRAERYGYGSYRPRREMYPAVCAECGRETQVPFEAREGRPVYCSDCYDKVRLSHRR